MKRLRVVIASVLCVLLAACGTPVHTTRPPAPAAATETAPHITVSASASAITPDATASASPASTPAPGVAESEFYIVKSNRRTGVVDGRGSEVLPIRYSKVDELLLAGTDAVFFAVPADVREKKTPKTAELGELYDENGRKLADGQFRYAYAYGDKYIQAAERGKNGALQFGFLDIDGKTLVPFMYDDAQVADFGLIGVKGEPERIGKTVDIYDENGKLLRSGKLNFRYPYGKYISICDKTGVFSGLAESDFHIVVPAVWDEARPCVNGRFIVRSGDMTGVIDADGKQIIPLQYYEINETDKQPGESTLFAATAKDGVHLFDEDGKELYHSAAYAQINYAAGCIIAGDTKNAYHVLDMGGREILSSPGYVYWLDEAQVFVCGGGNKQCDSYYTKDGVKLPLPNADFITYLTPDRYLFGFYGQNATRYGLCDRRGNVIVEPKYSYMYRDAGDGRLIFAMQDKEDSQLFGLMDMDGHTLLPPVYAALYGWSGSNLLYAEYGVFHGLINRQGNWIWSATDYDGLVD